MENLNVEEFQQEEFLPQTGLSSDPSLESIDEGSDQSNDEEGISEGLKFMDSNAHKGKNKTIFLNQSDSTGVTQAQPDSHLTLNN